MSIRAHREPDSGLASTSSCPGLAGGAGAGSVFSPGRQQDARQHHQDRGQWRDHHGQPAAARPMLSSLLLGPGRVEVRRDLPGLPPQRLGQLAFEVGHRSPPGSSPRRLRRFSIAWCVVALTVPGEMPSVSAMPAVLRSSQ